MAIKPNFILVLFYLFGFTLSLLGPIEYEGIYHPYFVIYFMTFIFLFMIGFQLGATAPKETVITQAPSVDIPKLYIFTLVLSLTYSIYLFSASILQNGISAISLQAGAVQYADFYTGYVRNSEGYNINWIISELIYPAHMATLAWSFFLFGRMGLLLRFLAIIAAILIVVNFGIMAGKMKIVGDFIVVASFILLAVLYRQQLKLLRVGAILGGLMLGMIVIILIISYRYELAGVGIYNIAEKASGLLIYNEDSIFLDIFGPNIGFAVITLTAYFSNGYYGLSLALNLPFEWTYFVGNSYSMMVILDRFAGGEFLLENTYPFRTGIEYGWGMNKWHSALAWFASDLTFPGTLVFFAFVSFLYGRIWRAVTYRKNVFAVPIYAYLSIGFIFIPANNQLMISPGGILTLGLFLLIWLWPRKAKRPKSSLQTQMS